jgi:putative NIF3 family GTP cyclohydrolase 1 type 2
MAAKLGLQNVSILDEDGEGTGLGVVGDLPQPLSAEEAVTLVKDELGLKMMKASRPVEGKISRVAMCGGSGSSLIKAAMSSGAQLYISGDISYHNFFTREGFMIMDIGHYESEIEIVDILFSLLRKNFPTFAVRITQNIYSNPIFYF